MLAWLERFKRYLVAIGAALVLAVGTYLRGRSAGKGGGAGTTGCGDQRTGRSGPQGGA